MDEQRTIYVFETGEPGGTWYKVCLPFSNEFSMALWEEDARAWGSILTALDSLVRAAQEA